MAVWSPSSSLILNGCLFAFLLGTSAATQCYYPNGNNSTDTPCYTDGRITHCCSPNSICLTNQLCVDMLQPYTLSRGSCTDKSWGDICTTICHSAQPGAGASLVPYNNGTTAADSADPQYCCNSVVVSPNDTLVCSRIYGSWQDPFTIPNGSIIPDVAGLKGLVRESSTSSTSSSIANNTGNHDTASTSDCNKSSKDVAIGAGIGVPLGCIALLAIVWALWERRQRSKVKAAQSIPTVYNVPAAHIPDNLELPSSSPKPAELYDSSNTSFYR